MNLMAGVSVDWSVCGQIHRQFKWFDVSLGGDSAVGAAMESLASFEYPENLWWVR